MDSMYAQYLKERTDDKILEMYYGFVTYRILDSSSAYVIDLFILPEFRRKGYGTKIVNTICEDLKKMGIQKIVGTVNPSCKNSHQSMLALIAYGMKLKSCSENIILLDKDI